MGVLYEHWRPDLNECFYVGASWANPETRPYEMSGRNDDHIRIQEELAAKGLAPEVKVIDCSFLLDEELDELETLQIVYWKDLIGDRLVNIATGGRVGWGFAWSDEMCDRQSEIMEKFYQTDAGRDSIAKTRETLINKYKSPDGERIKSQITTTLIAHFKTPAGIAQAKEHGEWMKAWNEFYYSTPEGDLTKQKIAAANSANKTEFYQSERGKKTAEEQGKIHSIRLLELYASPRGKILREEQSVRASKQMQGDGNPGSSISEEIAQAILDAEELTAQEAADKFGCSSTVVGLIKNRHSWRHLEPTSGYIPPLIDGRSKTRQPLLSEQIAQEILDFAGTHEAAAERFGISVRRARSIRERKTWRHLTPSNG